MWPDFARDFPACFLLIFLGKFSARRFGLTLSILCFCALQSSGRAAPGDQVFDDLQIHEVRFEFDQVDWYEDLEWSWENRDYISGAVTVNGVFYDSVGVRFKGLSSYLGYPTDKKPFRIKFNEYREYDWDGLRKVSLNNGWNDPTLIKEKLHLDFLRRHDSDAPRGSFAKVYVNDTYWGFYSLVEHVDKVFLDDRIGNNDGNLYKADVDARLRWEGPLQEDYYDNFELKTNEQENDWSDFIDLVDKLFHTPQDAFQDSLETIFNPSSHIQAWAVNTVTHNWDSYLWHGRNYYLYRNTTTGVFDWISTDVSLTLGGLDRPPSLSLYYAPLNHPLHFRMLQVPEYRSEYVTRVGNLVRNDFRSAIWNLRIDELAQFVQADYLADSKRQYTDEEFTQGILDLKEWIRLRIEDIKGQIDIGLMDRIVINELMYNSSSDPESLEYVELYNTLPSSEDIGGWGFSDGVEFTFPAGTLLLPQEYIVVTNDRSAFIDVYGETSSSFEWTSGRLSNGGERIALVDEEGLVIDQVTYGDGNDWPAGPDGTGPSLELIHPSFDNDLGISWLASNVETAPNGTPGGQNSAFSSEGADPVIGSEPKTVAYVGLEYAYLVEAADAERDTLTYALTLAPDFITIDPFTGLVTGIPSNLDLGSHAVEIQVSDRRGGVAGQTYTLEVTQPDPVYAIVINELHYNPAGEDSTEFIELTNAEAFDVDLSGWAVNDGVKFVFPPGSIARAGEFVVLAYRRSAIEAVYGLSDVYQWTEGRLANSGETIELSNATGISVDAVSYGDQAPWPELPDGGGPSLGLLSTDLDNALPSSWRAEAKHGTPGDRNGGSPTGDDDGNASIGTGLVRLTPNPFESEVVIQFQLAEAGSVRLSVYDVVGRHVLTLAETEMTAGSHEIPWRGLGADGRLRQPGVYFLRLLVKDTISSHQLVLLR